MRPRRQPTFDPYAILHALEREHVAYVIIGGLARVLQGSDELTRGLDITPSLPPENLERLEHALGTLDARRRDGRPLALDDVDPGDEPVIELESERGELKLVLEPAGTRGYADLRRKAQRLHLGEGLRPRVANPGDLVRMLESQGREHDTRTLEAMRRVVELDRGFGLSL